VLADSNEVRRQGLVHLCEMEKGPPHVSWLSKFSDEWRARVAEAGVCSSLIAPLGRPRQEADFAEEDRQRRRPLHPRRRSPMNTILAKAWRDQRDGGSSQIVRESVIDRRGQPGIEPRRGHPPTEARRPSANRTHFARHVH